jgi:hypothetical protein
MKKLIRLIIKLPITPIVVLFCSLGYILFSVLAFIQWVYESSEFNKEVTAECQNDMIKILKNWFTTI